MKVKKRDGKIVDFEPEKIRKAIKKCFQEVGLDLSKVGIVAEPALDMICDILVKKNNMVDVEDIQDIVEEELMNRGFFEAAKAYIKYRYKHQLTREFHNTTDNTIMELISGENEYWNTENANKRAYVNSTQRDYIAGITSTDIARRLIFPKDCIDAHDKGIIHIHDMDYAVQKMHNCGLINLKDCLDNGTVINGIKIESPHRFITACTIASQICLQVSSSQYGGMTVSIAHLAPYLSKSYDYWLKVISDPDEADKCWKKELTDGVQTFNYQMNSFTGSNGQSPFSTVFIDLEEDPNWNEYTRFIAEEFLKQRLLGFKNEDGVYITPTFPKLIVVLRDKYFEDPKYSDFIRLCAECTAKRMVPDYISEKKMLEYKGEIIPPMGCRSLLSKHLDENGNSILWGRFNCGVGTINLPYIAYLAKQENRNFYEILNTYLDLIHKAQLVRLKRLASATSDVAPTLWQHGVYGRLKSGEPLSNLIYGGYATISLGYCGVYETTQIMTGESQSGEKGFKFAEELMAYLDRKTQEWTEEDNIKWGVYGTPIESTTYKFAKALKQFEYDRDYVTNSIHVPVFEEIDPITKLEIEGKLQKYSTGGNVNYIEASDLSQNLDAIITIMKAINDNCMYAEINSKHDYCHNCGSEAEQQIDEEMNWYCPVCGCKDPMKLYHARRVCGYIQTGEYNKGRTQDIKERYVHLDNHDL